MTAAADIETWVFDLDNTLYPPSARLFDLIEVKMTAWIVANLGVNADTADRMRQTYWRKYGTTLAGLMAEHQVDPWPFLNDVHDVSMASLTPDPELAHLINGLPGRKIVYTNGDAPYAGRVLAARGLDGLFDAIYGIEHADWAPKPDAVAFARVFERDGLTPDRAVMFEDDPRNLAVPHGLGMVTVHVAPTPAPAPHIHHHTDNLTEFLSQIAAGGFPAPVAGPI